MDGGHMVGGEEWEGGRGSGKWEQRTAKGDDALQAASGPSRRSSIVHRPSSIVHRPSITLPGQVGWRFV